MKDWKERLQWFKDRINKTVYKDINMCCCGQCEKLEVTVLDELHAFLLFKSENCGSVYKDINKN